MGWKAGDLGRDRGEGIEECLVEAGKKVEFRS